jgi:peptidyl-prolyl cis-trans isomerase C
MVGIVRGRIGPALAALALSLALAACGASTEQGDKEIRRGVDPVIAATVNGKPIYVDDVIVEAIRQGFIENGQDLDPNSDAFYQVTQSLIETRLLADEAASRGLDKTAEGRRKMDIARERILAGLMRQNISDTALTDAALERFYRQQMDLLGKTTVVRFRQIKLKSKERAMAAKSRLDGGDPFPTVAFEMSEDANTASDGGDVNWVVPENLSDSMQEALRGLEPGQIAGPFESEGDWYLITLEERRAAGVPSMESLRPRLEHLMRMDEERALLDKLRKSAKVELYVDENPAQGRQPVAPPREPDGATDQGVALPPGAAEGVSPPPAAPPPVQVIKPPAPDGRDT